MVHFRDAEMPTFHDKSAFNWFKPGEYFDAIRGRRTHLVLRGLVPFVSSLVRMNPIAGFTCLASAPR